MRYFVVAIILALPLTASAEGDIKAMKPLSGELLTEAIELPDCSGVKIIEWRPTPGFEASTQPRPESISVIDQTCVLATGNFKKFLDHEGITVPKTKNKFVQSVCLMPARPDRFGEDFRNLNDAEFRFSTRPKSYSDNGLLRIILGFTEHVTNNIYIGNDVLRDDLSVNDRFVTIFAHEMFHAMSWHYGVYWLHSGDKSPEDEAMARRFTVFLKLGQ